MANDYSVIEPLGHINPQSKLERYWGSFEGSYGLRTTRIIQFDPYASMSRSPVRYTLSPFFIEDKLPDDSWIFDQFKAFVRDEIGLLDSVVPPNLIPSINKEIKISDDFLSEFIQNSEWENMVQLELPKSDSEEEMAERIYNLLCNPQIGSSKNRKNNNLEEFIKDILPTLTEKKRLLFPESVKVEKWRS